MIDQSTSRDHIVMEPLDFNTSASSSVIQDVDDADFVLNLCRNEFDIIGVDDGIDEIASLCGGGNVKPAFGSGFDDSGHSFSTNNGITAIPVSPPTLPPRDHHNHYHQPQPTPDQPPQSSMELLERNVLSLTSDKMASMDVLMSVGQADPNDIETILSKEFNSLQIKEQEHIIHDTLGIGDVRYETKQFQDTKLEEFEYYIKMTANSDMKGAYNRALYINPSYVNDRTFRLQFLRSDNFDSKLAAERYIRHFDQKQKLFCNRRKERHNSCDSDEGSYKYDRNDDDEILGRDVMISDLDEHDMFVLNSGYMQLLPIRDRGGRAIFIMVPEMKVYNTFENMLRVYWYLSMTAYKDIETQLRGAILIMYTTCQNSTNANGIVGLSKWNTCRNCVPERIVSSHWCYSSEDNYQEVQFVRAFMGKKWRLRTKLLHTQSTSNYQLQLQTYGIPGEHLPLDTKTGKLMLNLHLDWIERQRVRESASSRLSPSVNTNGIPIVPRRFDVLFGKGSKIAEHTGNLRALHIVEMYQDKYEKANKFEKTEIAERIVNEIHESYGRFLIQDTSKKGASGSGNVNGGKWKPVTHEVARSKISKFFRRLREEEKKGKRNRNGGGITTGGDDSGGAATTQRTKNPKQQRPEYDDDSEDVTVVVPAQEKQVAASSIEQRNNAMYLAKAIDATALIQNSSCQQHLSQGDGAGGKRIRT